MFKKYPETYETIPYVSRQKAKTPKRKPNAGTDSITRMVTIIDQKTRLEVQKPIWEVASSHMARKLLSETYTRMKVLCCVTLQGRKKGIK